MNENIKNKKTFFKICKECKGRGKKSRRIRKKTKLQYLEKQNIIGSKNIPPPPKGQLYVCAKCSGSGLSNSTHPIPIDLENYPNIAIIGGGIGGIALAVACLHRGIPFTLYERDDNFEARSQGYGLTLQQAAKAIEGFGLFSLEDGIVSTRHVVHNTKGEIIGEWGMRKWVQSDKKRTPKRTNIHISRQSLRLDLLKQLGKHNHIKWGHQLVNLKESNNNDVAITFKINGKIKQVNADLVVGADGIRSTVRNQIIDETNTPLRYLGCIVILGICSLKELECQKDPLLDSATVFQTTNGKERIYMMPYDSNSIMWQLSYPIAEQDAKSLSSKGSYALKKEACIKTQWHDPIPEILAATPENLISGYPVYDRELLKPEWLQKNKNTTLIGDAAHPMSPFKGQGANQALLDALLLAREISKECRPLSNWKETGIRECVLNNFESEMLNRSAIKVKDSAEAAIFLHSEMILHKSDQPRGSYLKRKKNS